MVLSFWERDPEVNRSLHPREFYGTIYVIRWEGEKRRKSVQRYTVYKSTGKGFRFKYVTEWDLLPLDGREWCSCRTVFTWESKELR
jgi:hypothetical protein